VLVIPHCRFTSAQEGDLGSRRISTEIGLACTTHVCSTSSAWAKERYWMHYELVQSSCSSRVTFAAGCVLRSE